MSSIWVKVISASDNASTSFDYGLGNAIVENPLVDAVNGQDAHAGYDHISVTVLRNKDKSTLSNTINHYQYPEDPDLSYGISTNHQKYSSRYPFFSQLVFMYTFIVHTHWIGFTEKIIILVVTVELRSFSDGVKSVRCSVDVHTQSLQKWTLLQ